MTNEQRHFTRIPFNAVATITHTRSGHKFMSELVDISLKGVLVCQPKNWQENKGEQYTIHIQLAKDEVEINLEVIAVHSENDHIGFKTEHMDLDTATHLHRLVELNLGDEKLLERELSELVQLNN